MKIKRKKISFKRKKELLDAYENKKFDISEELSLLYIKQDPSDSFLWKILGLTYMETNKLSDALDATKKNLSLDPKDYEAHNNLGLIFKMLNKKNEALNCYKKAINLKSDFFAAYKNLGTLFNESGDVKKALQYYNEAYKISPDPEIHHLINSLSGTTESKFNKEYAEILFDDQAKSFENLLVGKLDYQLPKIVSNFLVNMGQNNSLGSILDLGCGTGLFGKEIKKYCNYLEGVDISKSMLNEALNKKTYNKLVHADISDYLLRAELKFDIFISLDTFIYIGNIEEIFRLIVSRNKSEGIFIFSTELYEEEGNVDYNLEKSGRYSHSHSYIESLCEKFNYEIKFFEKVKLRKERKSNIIGGLYVLEF